jgi:perosamine synthetase
MTYKIPVYESSLNGNEKRYVNECLESTWISGKGRFVSLFEEAFSDYIGGGQSASVCNGTVALHLALTALGIGPGDEVIVPTFTYIAPVNVIVQCGATPIFVDSIRDTWQADPAAIRRKITAKTRAIIVVHLYGHPCDMDAICAIAREHKIFLVEDCAEAFGSYYKGRHVGLFGDIGTFSFYGNKTITTGEGGMVVTQDRALHERMTHLKGQGLAKYREYWHDIAGFNYRMTNICAAIGLAQLEQADMFIARKRQIADWYKADLAGTDLIVHPVADDVRHSYWMVSALVPDIDLRDPVRKLMADAGIETRPTFYPVHKMPMYSARYERHPVADDIAARGINLPSYPGLDRTMVNYVTKALKQAVATARGMPRRGGGIEPEDAAPATATPA